MNLWDGYSMRINNYRVFCNHENGRVYFIPHGLDRLFDDPTDPVMPEWKGRVTRVLLETPETRKLYLNRLAELTRQLMSKTPSSNGWTKPARRFVRPQGTEPGPAPMARPIRVQETNRAPN